MEPYSCENYGPRIHCLPETTHNSWLASDTSSRWSFADKISPRHQTQNERKLYLWHRKASGATTVCPDELEGKTKVPDLFVEYVRRETEKNVPRNDEYDEFRRERYKTQAEAKSTSDSTAARSPHFYPDLADPPTLPHATYSRIIASPYEDSVVERVLLQAYRERVELSITENSDDPARLDFLEHLDEDLGIDLAGVEREVYHSGALNRTHSFYSPTSCTFYSPMERSLHLPTHEPEPGSINEPEPHPAEIIPHLRSFSELPGSSPHTSSPVMEPTGQDNEEVLFGRVRQLRHDTRVLRNQIYSSRMQFLSNEDGIDEGQQQVLNEYRNQLAEHDSEKSQVIMLDRQLAFAIKRIFDQRRDEYGPLLENIRFLENNLADKEYELGQAETQLHNLYTATRRTSYQVEDTPESYAASNYEIESTQRSSVARTARLFDDAGDSEDGDDERSEDWRNGPTNVEIYDPSKYHPDYVKMTASIGEMKLMQERLNYFSKQEVKLLDQKETRERIGLSLAKENEELLESLPMEISKLEVALEEAEEEVDELRQKCLLAGIIDEDDEPVEKLEEESEESEEDAATSDNDEEEDDYNGNFEAEQEESEDGYHSMETSYAQGTGNSTPQKGEESSMTSEDEDIGPFTPLTDIHLRRQAFRYAPPRVKVEPTISVNRASSGDRGSSNTAKNKLLARLKYNPSITSGFSRFACTANSHSAPRADPGPDPHRVETWIFDKLRRSHSEVRLLATIVRANGIPLLEETAQAVIRFWHSPYHGSGIVKKMEPELVEKVVLEEGFDRLLVEQIVSEDWEHAEQNDRLEQIETGGNGVGSNFSSEVNIGL